MFQKWFNLTLKRTTKPLLQSREFSTLIQTRFAFHTSTNNSTTASSTNLTHSIPEYSDVVIMGGGVMGSSVAYFLSSLNSNLKISVIEQDHTYTTCATARSAGSIRLQFSTPENIQMSLFGAQFLKNIENHLRVSDDIGFKLQENGYLFLATHAAAGVLSQNTQIQNSHGAKTLLLSPDQISARFPFLNTSNLHSGSFGLENEGWFDPYLLMTSFRKKAISQGVNYIQGKVVGFKQDPHNKNRVTKVYLERWDSSSNSLHKTEIGVKSFVVNSSGISGYLLSKLVDPKFDLPVRPRKRFIYVVSLKEPLPKNCPLVIDPTGIYFRPEGNNYICGMSPPEHEDPDCTDLVVNPDLFENTIWPILAERVPAFEHAKNTTAWAGHYDYNTFDQNAILGHHPTIPNFLLCNGFSGHGLQQSPAVGRALSELILHGKYLSIDLKRFSAERILNNTPILEANVV